MISQDGINDFKGFLLISRIAYQIFTRILKIAENTKPSTRINDMISPSGGFFIRRIPIASKKQILQINATLDKNLNAVILVMLFVES